MITITKSISVTAGRPKGRHIGVSSEPRLVGAVARKQRADTARSDAGTSPGATRHRANQGEQSAAPQGGGESEEVLE